MPLRRGRYEEHPARTRPGLADPLRSLAWQDRAACRDVALDFATAERATGEHEAICAACTVLGECRSYAAQIHASAGVWAGRRWSG